VKKYSIPIAIVLIALFSSFLCIFNVKALDPSFPWDPGIQVIPRPAGVWVSVSPKIVPPNSVGLNEERWVPYNSYGQTFIYWQGKNHLEGTVTIYWKEQISDNTFGLTWRDLPVDPEIHTFPWQIDRPEKFKPQK